MEAERGRLYYVMIININTRFLWCDDRTGKSAAGVAAALTDFLNQHRCTNIRGDAEAAFRSDTVTRLLTERGVSYYWNASPYTNRNRIIDRAMRTIRDGFGLDRDLIKDPASMKRMVKLYNYTPHAAYRNLFTPIEVQRDRELEAMYIRAQQDRLHTIRQLQVKDGYMSYKPGNILYVHLDDTKTERRFDKVRRQFSHLGVFIRYAYGNVVCDMLPRSVPLMIPVQHTKLAYESYALIPDRVKRYFGV